MPVIKQKKVKADTHPYATNTASLAETGINLHKENYVSVFLCCGSAEQELMAVTGANCKCRQGPKKEREITLWRCE